VKWIKFLAFGAIVAGLYGMLFAFEADVIRLCKQGGWYFLFPGMFWDVLGVQAKQSK
jgi:hypothetical protein